MSDRAAPGATRAMETRSESVGGTGEVCVRLLFFCCAVYHSGSGCLLGVVSDTPSIRLRGVFVSCETSWMDDFAGCTARRSCVQM